jgi:hypothetical protein
MALGSHLQELWIRGLEKRKALQEGKIMLQVSSVGNCTRRLAYDIFRQMALEDRDGVPEELRNTLKFKPVLSSHELFNIYLENSIRHMIQRWLMDMKWLRCEPYLDEEKLLQWKGDAEIQLKDDDLRIMGCCNGITTPLQITPDGDLIPCPNCKGESTCGICGRYLIEIKCITDRPKILANDYEDISKWEKVPSDTNIPLTGGGIIVTLPGRFTELINPEPEHIAQAHMHTYLIKKHLGIDIKGIIFLYVAKDADLKEYEEESVYDVPVKQMITPISSIIQEQVLSRVHSVWEHVDKGELPPRNWYYDGCGYTPFECYYQCEFTRLCYPEMRDEVEWDYQRVGGILRYVRPSGSVN